MARSVSAVPPLAAGYLYVRRRMAATEVTGGAKASGASCRTVASTVARLAVLVGTRCGRSVPTRTRIHGKCPLVAAARGVTKLKVGAGCPSRTRVVSARCACSSGQAHSHALRANVVLVHTEDHEQKASNCFARNGRFNLEALWHAIGADA